MFVKNKSALEILKSTRTNVEDHFQFGLPWKYMDTLPLYNRSLVEELFPVCEKNWRRIMFLSAKSWEFK